MRQALTHDAWVVHSFYDDDNKIHIRLLSGSDNLGIKSLKKIEYKRTALILTSKNKKKPN